MKATQNIPPSTSGADSPDDEPWRIVIRPDGRWFDLRLRELWQYRDLIALFVKRDFVSQFKQTLLGPAWHIITPVLTTLVFTVIFGQIAGVPTDGTPPFLFYLSGTTMWNFFSRSLVSTSGIFVANAGVFGKVYFPRLAVPVASLVSNLISFTIQFALFLLVLGFFMAQDHPVAPNRWALALPLLLLISGGLGLGAGVIASALTAKYRDLGLLISYGVTLLMYFTPVIYPLSAVPPSLRPLVVANPITAVHEAFRYGFLGEGEAHVAHLGYSAAVALFLVVAGVLLFHRVERTFMDTV